MPRSFTLLASQYFGFLTMNTYSWGFHSLRRKGPFVTMFSGLVHSVPDFSIAHWGRGQKELCAVMSTK